MTTDSAATSRRAPDSSQDAVSSKMEKTHVSPPLRQRRRTIKDDLNVKYVGEDISKVGTQGRRVELSGNMYKITANSNVSIHQYSVVFEPEVKFSGLKDFLISECNLGLYHYNYNCIFLPNDDQKEFTKSVKRRDGSEVKIIFKHINKLQPNSPQMFGMMGNLAKWCISKIDMTKIGQGLFLLDSKTPIGDFGMDVIAGYNTTVLPHEDDIQMTINMVNKVMNGKNANDYMKSIMRESNGNKNAIMEEIIGKTVLTTYNNKTYKVDDIDFNLNPKSTFKRRNKDGEEEDVSYMDYFRQQYNLNIRDEKQPLFISRKKKVDRRKGHEEESIVCLIPETCVVTGIPEKLFTNFQFKKAMDMAIKKDPGTRARFVKNFMDAFKRSKPYGDFQKWGFELASTPSAIPARELNSYKVEFAGGQTKGTERPFDMRGVRMFDTGPEMRRVVLISPDGCREAGEFMQKLNQVGQPLGLSIGRPKEFGYRTPSDVNQALSKIKALNGKADMIIVILRNQDKTLYDHVKKECCVEMGVPSQCLLMKHFRNPKGLLSVITKIALQMGVKMGGAGWSIKFPAPQTYMIVGMDTYHDSARKGYSCVAVVASLNNSLSKYTWATAMVPHKQEVNTVIKEQFNKLIKQFVRLNNATPTKIVIFRDGVGEGQVPTIMEHEFTQIQASIDERAAGAQMAFFTLSKRIETRFYNQGRNPNPGTVVDQVATHGGQKDFYLIPLESRQGSVTPICYRNHFNTLKLKADNFQYMAYMLSFMYFNWSGAIKVPNVCQYAHKLAFLVGTSIHRDPHADLEDKLFFL